MNMPEIAHAAAGMDHIVVLIRYMPLYSYTYNEEWNSYSPRLRRVKIPSFMRIIALFAVLLRRIALDMLTAYASMSFIDILIPD